MQASQSQPNIVLLSIDSLRADHCGFLGDDRGLTPTFDRLASEGVAFQNAIATGPQTFSSMPAVFTGRHRPPTTLQTRTDMAHWERRMSAVSDHLDRHGTIPERLQAAGYTTAGFSPNPWMSSNAGADRGFDHFRDLSGDPSQSLLHGLADRLVGVGPNRKAVEITLDLLTGQSFFAQWEAFYEQLLATVQDLSHPYFLWVFLMDTHFPFIASRAHRREQSGLGMYTSMIRSEGPMRGEDEPLSDSVEAELRESYRDTVRAVDAFLAELESDLAGDDPVTVVHSDHGESFGDHGSYGHHHRQIYEENVHVPLVVHNAGVSADVQTPTSLAEIHDGLLQIGRHGTLDPQPLASSEVFTASECGRNSAVRAGRFKFIRGTEGDLLFDLQRDPGETTDVSDERPELRREYEHSLESFMSQQEEVQELGIAASRVSTRGRL